MKKGMTLERLSDILDFQNEHKRDFVVNTDSMKVTLIRTVDQPKFELNFKDNSRRKARVFSYPMSRHMLLQMAQHIAVPISLIDSMIKGTEKEQISIVNLITTRLKENPSQRLIRTLTPATDKPEIARAFLSDRYRIIDNYDLMQSLFPLIQQFKGDLKIDSMYLNDERLYIRLTYPKISGSMGTAEDDMGYEVDDIVEAGVTISNSEVGAGPVLVQPYLKRLVCSNGSTVMMKRVGQRKIHIGRKMVTGDVLGLMDDNTQFFDNLREVLIQVIGDKDFYTKAIKQFGKTKEDLITDDDEALKLVARKFKLSEWETLEIGTRLAVSRTTRDKHTRFDLINAITNTALSTSKKMTYTRALELEGIGGHIIEMTKKEWNPIGTAEGDIFDV